MVGGGEHQYSRCINILRWFFGACNIVFLLFGFLCLGIGTWGLYNSYTEDTDVVYGSTAAVVFVLLIVAGAITIVVSSMGFIGSAGMYKYVLLVYGVFVIAIIAIEIASAIAAFLLAENARDEIEDNMFDALIGYRVNETLHDDFDSNTNNAVDYVQSIFECCGVNNYTDWVNKNPEAIWENTNVPPGGCFCDANEDNCNARLTFDILVENNTRVINITTNVWDRGCLSLVDDYTEGAGYFNGGIGFVIAGIEATFVLMAFILVRAIWMRNRKNIS